MIEIEAIKRIKECKNTPNFQPYTYMNEALNMAIKALEKQIAKKPRFYASDYYCSVCGNLVGDSVFEWRRFKYCDTCGQKLDWSREQEDEHE